MTAQILILLLCDGYVISLCAVVRLVCLSIKDMTWSHIFIWQFPMVVPFTFLVVVVFLLVTPLFAAPHDTGMGVLITCSGIPVYVLGIVWKNKPRTFRNLQGILHTYNLNSPFASMCVSVHAGLNPYAHVHKLIKGEPWSQYFCLTWGHYLLLIYVWFCLADKVTLLGQKVMNVVAEHSWLNNNEHSEQRRWSQNCLWYSSLYATPNRLLARILHSFFYWKTMGLCVGGVISCFTTVFN